MKALVFNIALVLLFLYPNKIESARIIKASKRQLVNQPYYIQKSQNPQNFYQQIPIHAPTFIPVTQSYYHTRVYPLMPIPVQVQVPQIPVRMPNGRIRLIKDPYLRLQLMQPRIIGYNNNQIGYNNNQNTQNSNNINRQINNGNPAGVVQNALNNNNNVNVQNNNGVLQGNNPAQVKNNFVQRIGKNAYLRNLIDNYKGGNGSHKDSIIIHTKSGMKSRNSEGDHSCSNSGHPMKPLQRKINLILNKLFLKKKKKQKQEGESSASPHSCNHAKTTPSSCDEPEKPQKHSGSFEAPITVGYIESEDEYKVLNGSLGKAQLAQIPPQKPMAMAQGASKQVMNSSALNNQKTVNANANQVLNSAPLNDPKAANSNANANQVLNSAPLNDPKAANSNANANQVLNCVPLNDPKAANSNANQVLNASPLNNQKAANSNPNQVLNSAPLNNPKAANSNANANQVVNSPAQNNQKAANSNANQVLNFCPFNDPKQNNAIGNQAINSSLPNNQKPVNSNPNQALLNPCMMAPPPPQKAMNSNQLSTPSFLNNQAMQAKQQGRMK